MRDLPTLPNTISVILSLVNDSRSTTAGFTDIIKKDQVLTARLLRIVNSSLFGLNRKIASIQEAVVLLGIHRIKEISSAVSLGSLYRPKGEINGVDLWVHALATAQWTKEIIDYLKFIPDDQIYTTGLIHDLGIVVMGQLLEEDYWDVLNSAQIKNETIHRREQKMLGFTHAEIGSALCAKWNFPPLITKIVKEHHCYSPVDDKNLAILTLADYLATEIGLGNFLWEKQQPVSTHVYQTLNITDEDVTNLIDKSAEIFEYISIFEE